MKTTWPKFESSILIAKEDGFMKAGNDVLVFNPEEHADFIRVVTIDEENIPEQLNGESGFHVYHVRMLTELILRRLQKTGKCDLSDQAIESISAAAAVHDIGKSKIPKTVFADTIHFG